MPFNDKIYYGDHKNPLNGKKSFLIVCIETGQIIIYYFNSFSLFLKLKEGFIKRFIKEKPKVFQIVGWVIGGIIMAVIFAFLFGYFVMLLWNWLMPALFGLSEITYWMGFGIILLGRLIFGNFGPGHHKQDDHHKYFFRSRCRSDKFPKWNNFKKWHYYDDFWEEEGEEAFDNYIERKKTEKQNGEKENPAE